jgi:hypothetical protein
MTSCNAVLLQTCSIQPFRDRNNNRQHWILKPFWNSWSSTSLNTYVTKCRYRVCSVYAEKFWGWSKAW